MYVCIYVCSYTYMYIFVQGYGLDSSSPDRGKILFSPQKSRLVLGLSQPRFIFLGQSGRGVMLTTYLCLVPRLRLSGAVPLLPLCTSMAWIWTALSFLLWYSCSND
jgi:hypothetical protein